MNYVFPYEQQAMRNEELPKALTGFNVLIYFAYCYIYKLYNCGEISREQGTKLKNRIVLAINEAIETLQKYDNMWKRTETSAREYALNPSIENADKFYATVYNLPNDWRLKR